MFFHASPHLKRNKKKKIGVTNKKRLRVTNKEKEREKVSKEGVSEKYQLMKKKEERNVSLNSKISVHRLL